MRIIGNNTYIGISCWLLGKPSPPITWSTIKSTTWNGIEKVILHINRLQKRKWRVRASTLDWRQQILSISAALWVWAWAWERQFTLVTCFDDPTSSSSCKSSLSWALWLLPRWPHTSCLLNFSFIAVKSKSSSNLVAECAICNPKDWFVENRGLPISSPQTILAITILDWKSNTDKLLLWCYQWTSSD